MFGAAFYTTSFAFLTRRRQSSRKCDAVAIGVMLMRLIPHSYSELLMQQIILLIIVPASRFGMALWRLSSAACWLIAEPSPSPSETDTWRALRRDPTQ